MDPNAPLQLTPEQSAAIGNSPDAIYVVDPTTQRRFILLEQPSEDRLTVDELRGMLDEAIAESDRGECLPWNAEEFKQEVRRRLARQSTN